MLAPLAALSTFPDPVQKGGAQVELHAPLSQIGLGRWGSPRQLVFVGRVQREESFTECPQRVSLKGQLSNDPQTCVRLRLGKSTKLDGVTPEPDMLQIVPTGAWS